MSNGALYFPWISPPNSRWFDRVLIYWDQATVIVPPEASRDDFTPRTRELFRADLMSFVYSHDFDRSNALRKMSQLVSLLLRDEAMLERLRLSFEGGNRVALYSSKLCLIANEELSLFGLATSRESGQPMEFEAHVGNLLMAILAQALADDRNLDAVTDELAALSRAQAMLYPPGQQLTIRTQHARGRLLELTVPSPRHPQPVAEIVRFKELHRDLVGHFRQRIEDEALSIAREDQEETREAVRRRVEDRLEAEIDELEARMRESHWQVDRRGAIVSIATPAAAFLAGVVDGSEATIIGSAGLGLLALWQNLFPQERADRLRPDLAFAVKARSRAL